MSQTAFEKNQKILPIEPAETVNITEGKNTDADMHLKKRLPLIKCECGSEILLLPDLQAMNRAIKNHASEHLKKERNTERNSNTSDKISLLLSQLVLRKIIE